VSLGFGWYLLWYGEARGHAPSSLRIALTASAVVAALASMGVLARMAYQRHKLCRPYRTARW
jgi:hypothetical protein